MADPGVGFRGLIRWFRRDVRPAPSLARRLLIAKPSPKSYVGFALAMPD